MIESLLMITIKHKQNTSSMSTYLHCFTLSANLYVFFEFTDRKDTCFCLHLFSTNFKSDLNLIFFKIAFNYVFE